MCTDTTSPPSARSGSKAAVKSPTEGCEVVGSVSALAQLLEEGRVVGDLDLRHGAVAPEDDVQRHDVNAVTLDQLRR